MTDNSVNVKRIFIILLMMSVFVPIVCAEQENYEILRIYENKNNNVSALSFSDDGSYLATGSEDNNLNFYYTDGDLLWNYNKMEEGVMDVSVSSDGSYIAAVDQIRVYLFTKEGGEPLWVHEMQGFTVAISSDGSNIVVGTQKGEVTLLDKEGNLLWTLRTGDVVNDVSISSNGSYMVAGSSDHNIYLYNKDGELWNHKFDDDVMKVSISPDGSSIVSKLENESIFQLNQEGEILNSNNYIADRVEGMSISSDGLYIADRSGYVYFFRGGELIWEYYTDSKISNDFSISSDGTYIATNSYSDINLFTSDKNRVHVNLKKIAEDVAHVIERSRIIVASKENEGYDLDFEKQFLLDAEMAYDNGDYTEARQLALRAEENALSINSDDVFRPIVYVERIIVAIVTLILLGLLLKVGLTRLNKIRIERKRLYTEKLRRNEEERRQKEKMKHEILNVIEEITGEGDE